MNNMSQDYFRSLGERAMNYKSKRIKAQFNNEISKLKGEDKDSRLMRDYSIFAVPQWRSGRNNKHPRRILIKHIYSVNMRNDSIGFRIFSNEEISHPFKYSKPKFVRDDFASIYSTRRPNYVPHYYHRSSININKGSSDDCMLANASKLHKSFSQRRVLPRIIPSKNVKREGFATLK